MKFVLYIFKLLYYIISITESQAKNEEKKNGKGKVHGIPLRQITCLSEKRFRELEKIVNKTGGRKISKEVIFHILIKRVPKKLLDVAKQLHQKPVDAFSGGPMWIGLRTKHRRS